jgi:hypothetical protein
MSVAQKAISSQFSSLTGTKAVDISIDSSTGTQRLKMSSEIRKDMTATVYQDMVQESSTAEIEWAFYRYLSVLGSYSNYAAGQEQGAAVQGAYGAGLRLKIDFP